MLQKPTITSIEAVPLAKIHLVVPVQEIRNLMGATIQELRAAIEAQGQKIAGPMVTHHLKPPSQTFDVEVCFPVSGTVQDVRRVEMGEWPAMTVARAVYQGGYEGLPDAWAQFTAWLRDRGQDFEPDIWESYIAGPETDLAPSEWMTELNRPLKGATAKD